MAGELGPVPGDGGQEERCGAGLQPRVAKGEPTAKHAHFGRKGPQKGVTVNKNNQPAPTRISDDRKMEETASAKAIARSPAICVRKGASK